MTYGTPTWIWSVAVDDTLYVRGYNGKNSRRYQAAMRQKTGRIHRGRDDEGSHLRASQWPINDLIDNAYGAKYQGSLYVSSMIGARVRSAIVKN